ncbi:MAG: tRNA 2-thiouridine(34) synthase MnmA [Planctomycetota bacterium]
MAERVVLAMSGGVDSSASALLLREAGYDVVGLFMRSGTPEPVACDAGPLPVVSSPTHKQGCCTASDAADARRVSDRLDMPFHAVDFSDGFGRIKDYFADEYLAGRTPNPCVMCNSWLKFGHLWEFAVSIGATKVATGHYARVRDGASGPELVRGVDRGKDQSYVLFGIERSLLPNILFPVGGMQKPEIRAIAGEAGLRTASKPDSQEICFVPDQDYAGFLKRHRGGFETAGRFIDRDGTVLGEHPGYEKFTIGQRRGLGVAFGEPRYVVRIDAETRDIVLGRLSELERTTLEADRANWLADVGETFRAEASIRYQHRAVPCTVDRDGDDAFRVTFDEPVTGVAPGQACVLYDGERVLGGGWIQ